MNYTKTARRVAWWDLVGLALGRDRRSLIVLPSLYLVAWAISHVPGSDALPEAMFESPRVLADLLRVFWAWI